MQTKVATAQQVAELLVRLTGHINGTASPEMFRVLADRDLSFTQMKMLYTLDGGAERPVSEIAERLSMSVAATSRSIDGLVRLGYVARRESDTDRRSRLVALLPKGRETLQTLLAAREAAVESFAASLPDAERTALRDALLPIAERIASP